MPFTWILNQKFKRGVRKGQYWLAVHLDSIKLFVEGPSFIHTCSESCPKNEGGEPPHPRWTRRLTEKMKTKSLPGRKGSLHLTYWFIRTFFLCEPIRPALIFCYQLIVSYEPFRPAYFFFIFIFLFFYFYF